MHRESDADIWIVVPLEAKMYFYDSAHLCC